MNNYTSLKLAKKWYYKSRGLKIRTRMYIANTAKLFGFHNNY